jgi:hypothetical protein
MPPDPRYPRKRLPKREEKRDRWWRRDAFIAVEECLRLGELSLHVAMALYAVLSFSDDSGKVVWAGQAAIGEAMGGRSARTARRWLRKAECLGFIEVEHRCQRVQGGRWEALTNFTRVVLPAEVEARRVARKGGDKGRATLKAPQNQSRSAVPGPGGQVGERPILLDAAASQQAANKLVDPLELAPPPLDDFSPAGRQLRERFDGVRSRVMGPP